MASAGTTSSGWSRGRPPRRPPTRRPPHLRRSLSSVALALLFGASLSLPAASALAAPPALAPAGRAPAGAPQPAAPAPGNGTALPRPPANSRTVEIRLALSTFALRTLSEPRVRRLVEIETEDVAVLAPGAIGPLGDHVAHVWIDQPTISKVVVEVRVGDRNVERREVAVRGLATDVAASLVAIAVSEMVRAGMAPKPPPTPPPAAKPPPTPEQIERASRSAPAVVLSPEATIAVLPGASGFLAGPGLSLGFRRFGLSEAIFGRWLTGSTPRSTLRWLEVGAAVEYRLWLGRSWRLAFGGSAALASLHVAEALRVAGDASRQALSARAGGLFAVEARIAERTWLSLGAEPGALLRATSFTTASGAGAVSGAWIGAGLSVRFERVQLPALP